MRPRPVSLAELQSGAPTLQVLDLAELETIEGGCLPILVAVAVAAVIITYAATAK
jgi:lactobin A/cerein 7B family class IIb bacteriocin